MSNALTFAKIVASPTPSSWSQAYNAGKLFAVLSLLREGEDDELVLSALGKDILNTLEEEFFTLEEKNLEKIKEAVTKTVGKIPEKTLGSLLVGCLNENVLYIFVYGTGEILLTRNGKTAPLLTTAPNESIRAASGHIQNGDIVTLQTHEFKNLVSLEELEKVLQTKNVSDISELLAPKVYDAQSGTACAMVVVYAPSVSPLLAQAAELTDEEYVDDSKDTSGELQPQSRSFKLPSFSFPKLPRLSLPTTQVSHKKRLIISIAIILLFVLCTSIYFTAQKKEHEKLQQELSLVLTPASKKYEEGQALVSLNRSLARDNFKEAKSSLLKNTTKFPKGSKEEKEVTSLLTKVEEALASISGENQVSTVQVDIAKSPLLKAFATTPSALSGTQDEKTVYLLTQDAVLVIDKASNEKKQIKNNDAWTSGKGIGVYANTFYILDTSTNQIIKVPVEGGSKSSYFASGGSQDFSKAVSMAIDGSIYVLTSDGAIFKFTRGKLEQFQLSGLSSPLVSPTRIITTPDFSNIYILEPTQRRIVVVNKSGEYQAQYTADLFQNAKEMDIVENDKKAFVAVNGKVFEIELK